ncbi:MAG: mercuric reductase [Planctomycetaceae bacterium]|nr:mercuric reductase [Planctomycetaceae bacterium]
MISPDDKYNQDLVNLVHPPGWENPRPQGRYDLVVIGGGTAGLVSAAGAAGLGAKVALIEKHLLGGDCLNTGCVPSKSLIAAARRVHAVRTASKLGVRISEPIEVDFPTIMERMRAQRSHIAHHDSAARFQGLGVDVFLGDAAFADDGQSVVVNDVPISFWKAVVCTGARAHVPDIPGLAAVGYLTNETLFSLTEQPRRLAVIGGGPIGCEMAQAFARFGTNVTLFEGGPRILSRDDAQASELVAQSMTNDGVEILFQCRVERVSQEEDGKVITARGANGELLERSFDEILVAVGRTPNIEGLNLTAMGVETSKTGIVVNDYLQTTNRQVYAAGDICSPYKFTHAADHQARVVIQNALFFGRRRASGLVVPRVTFTDPELAAVGRTGQEAADDPALTAWTVDLGAIDRGRTDGDAGFFRVWADGRGRIHGATVVGPHAGELLAPVTLAMTHGLRLSHVASTVHAYPTRSEALARIAGDHRKATLHPWVRAVLGWIARTS